MGVDPSVNWESPLKIGEFPVKWLPAQVIVAITVWALSLPVDLLGLICCFPLSVIYTKTGRWPKWGWAWRDHRGGEPEAWWWTGTGSYGTGKHWSTKWRWLGVYWWNAVRNPSSNFGRYWPWDDALPEDVRTTKGSHVGSLNPKYTQLQNKRFAHVIRWDTKRPWLAWFEFTFRWNDSKYMEFKFGFKVGGVNYEGLGYTLRFHPYRTYTA